MADEKYLDQNGVAYLWGKVKNEIDDKTENILPTSTTVLLSSSGWNSTAKTQTVSVPSVIASESTQLVLPMPAIASQQAYIDAGILCTAQGNGTLTFTASTIPTTNLTVYVVTTPVNAS